MNPKSSTYNFVKYWPILKILSPLKSPENVQCSTLTIPPLLSRFGSEFGVVDAAASWLRSYLTDRQQYVKVGEHSSVRRSSGISPQAAAVHGIRLSNR